MPNSAFDRAQQRLLLSRKKICVTWTAIRMKMSQVSFAGRRGSSWLRTAGVLIAALYSCPVSAAEPSSDRVVAKVNGAEIRMSDLAIAERDIGAQNLPPKDEDKKRDLLLNYLTDMILVTDAARAERSFEIEDIKRRVDFARKKVLMDKMLAQAAKDAVTDEAVRAAYQDLVKQFGNQVETRITDIPFRVFDPKVKEQVAAAETSAEKAIERLNKGETFAALAKELIENKLLKEKGGDLGYLSPEQLALLGLSDEVSKLKVGEYSRKPMKTVLAWHVVKVEDRRQRKPPEMESLRPQLEAFVVRKAQLDFMTDLRSQAKVERLDER
jgi:peptidyl-prolyl cis-trans isomerase C